MFHTQPLVRWVALVYEWPLKIYGLSFNIHTAICGHLSSGQSVLILPKVHSHSVGKTGCLVYLLSVKVNVPF